MQGYDAVVAGAAEGHVPPGLSSESAITKTYFSMDRYKAAMALKLVFGPAAGALNGAEFNVIDIVEFDSEYKIKSAMTYAPAVMVGGIVNMTTMELAPFVQSINAAAKSYLQAVIGYHGSPGGPAVWNSLWLNSPDTYWYDPVGSPIMQGYDAIVAGAAGGHVPDSAMNTSSVSTIYYGAGHTGAVLALSLCFTFVGGYCFDVIDVVEYDAASWLIKSADTYAPAGLVGVNMSAPAPAWETDTLASFNAYLEGIKNYHL